MPVTRITAKLMHHFCQLLMHPRDGHVPGLQWEIMSSNEAATGPPVSIHLLCRRHITYDGICHMLVIIACYIGQLQVQRPGLAGR